MKHARRFAALIAALLLLFACALADTARVYPDANGSFLLLRQDDQTLLIGSGGEAAVRRLAEASGLPGIDRVLILCDHPTHIESAQRMAALLDIGTDKIEANAICYGCDGKTLFQTPAATQQYVLNRNTKKFHKPTCGSVKQMKEKNRQVYEGTREEIIQRGYAPCKRCKP